MATQPARRGMLPAAPYPPINPRTPSTLISGRRSPALSSLEASQAPVSISKRDGRIAHAWGRTLWVGPTDRGPSAMESSSARPDEDISATMMRRARCSRKSRYSMDVGLSIQMLSEELTGSDVFDPDTLRKNFSLLRLWTWIERVEKWLEHAEEVEGWSYRGLLGSGVWQLLRLDSSDAKDESLFSESLKCPVFDSPERRMALTSCGWAGEYNLESILEECEFSGDFERSAALAVWHGNIGAAVEALHHASEYVRRHLGDERPSHTDFVSPRYAETLDLVAMCIAGYGGSSESSSRVWKNACQSLLKRDDLSIDSSVDNRIAYLRGLCQFLMHVGTPEGLSEVLDNPNLSICDRIAFACRYLDDKNLPEYLSKCIDSCQESGNLEGLIVTSLSKNGIKIIQSYVDQTADVQTAALLVSRTILPSNWSAERAIATEWVESYRGLLNTWQLWQSRAMFDVDRADFLRRVKMKSTDIPNPSKTMNRRLPMQQSGRRSGPRPPDPDVIPTIPAQLDVRCNYCSSSLGLKRHEGIGNQWLSKMKPVLSCCPQCRKPLPRCAICLLSLGSLNPYMEFARERARPVRGGPASQSPDDLSSLSNLPFAEWFAWCMRCKHGGHAHHLVGWFANHEECPVSGCDCRCQFDGIQKLARPEGSTDSP